MRKYLSHAFSQRSLTEQECLISKSINSFINKIGEDGAQGVDIVMAFTLMSFDIIGDLGFGETFRGIESSTNHVPDSRNISDAVSLHRRRAPLDISNDWCHDARRSGRLLQAFSNNGNYYPNILRRPHQAPYCGHEDQRRVLN